MPAIDENDENSIIKLQIAPISQQRAIKELSAIENIDRAEIIDDYIYIYSKKEKHIEQDIFDSFRQLSHGHIAMHHLTVGVEWCEDQSWYALNLICARHSSIGVDINFVNVDFACVFFCQLVEDRGESLAWTAP